MGVVKSALEAPKLKVANVVPGLISEVFDLRGVTSSSASASASDEVSSIAMSWTVLVRSNMGVRTCRGIG